MLAFQTITRVLKNLDDLKDQAESLGHIPTLDNEPGIIDATTCSCGWESNPYYDDRQLAVAEWARHAEQEIKKAEDAE